MGHIQTYASQAQNVLSTVELTTCLKQDSGKRHAMFYTCIKLFSPTPVYVCIYYAYLCMHIYLLAGYLQDLHFGGCSSDISFSYFFRASKVRSMLHNGSVGASSE